MSIKISKIKIVQYVLLLLFSKWKISFILAKNKKRTLEQTTVGWNAG